MPTALNWPASLPQLYQKGSFSYIPQGNILRTNMDSGIAKVRRLFTGVPNDYSGTMIFDAAQLITFQSFFDITIASGALTFNFPNPFDFGATTVEVRFKIDTKAAPYSLTPDGDTLDWDIDLNLESIPQ